MVLTTRTWCLVVLGLSACLPGKPEVVMPKGLHRAAVAIVAEAPSKKEPFAPPYALRQTVTDALSDRNVAPVEIPHGRYLASFATKKNTADRLAHVAEAGGGATLVVLVETFPRYYAQIEGRLRWTVNARITVAERGKLDRALGTSTSQAVFLNYPHEAETEALERATVLLRREVDNALDRFLGGLEGSPSK